MYDFQNLWHVTQSEAIYSNLQHECQTRAKRVGHEQHECNTSVTLAIRVRHECTQVRHECYTNDTSATRAKNFDFAATRVKTYFHILIFTIWQVKDYKERNNFILRTTFWKCLFSMPECA